MSSSSATATTSQYLEEMFGCSPLDGPSRPPNCNVHGILQTKNYETFTIWSDVGVPLFEFEGAKKANRCLPGDHVHWNTEHNECRLEHRDEHPPIVGVLELASKTRYGFTKRGIPMYLFIPMDKRYPMFIVGSAEKDLSSHQYALIKFQEWVEGSTMPRGALDRMLGHVGEHVAEQTALEWYTSPWVYSKSFQEILPAPEYADSNHRERLDGYSFNIDPPGCKDIDDVFTFAEQSDGTWLVSISISDVDGYIEDGGGVDILASLIGQTLYSPDGTVLRPMLPPIYSEDACSLRPGRTCYAVTLQFRWNGVRIEGLRWCLTELHNQYSYTYDEFMTANTRFREPLTAIATYLAKERGDTEYNASDAHDWVEQMMVLYNMEAGKQLKQLGQGILRRHSIPNMERLRSYQEYLPTEMHHLAMSAAEYCLADDPNTTHYGLSIFSAYAHASSPIRRYADLVNQRIMKRWLRGTLLTTEPYIVPITMHDLNLRDRAVRRYARDRHFLDAYLAAEQPARLRVRIMKVSPISSRPSWIKVHLYVPAWKRMISSTYECVSNDPLVVRSRDGKDTFPLNCYKEQDVECLFDLRQRNWKDRVILRFV